MWVDTADLPTSDGHPFFERLNRALEEAGCGEVVGAAVPADRTSPASFGNGLAVPGAWLLERFAAAGLTATAADTPCLTVEQRAAAAIRDRRGRNAGGGGAGDGRRGGAAEPGGRGRRGAGAGGGTGERGAAAGGGGLGALRSLGRRRRRWCRRGRSAVLGGQPALRGGGQGRAVRSRRPRAGRPFGPRGPRCARAFGEGRAGGLPRRRRRGRSSGRAAHSGERHRGRGRRGCRPQPVRQHRRARPCGRPPAGTSGCSHAVRRCGSRTCSRRTVRRSTTCRWRPGRTPRCAGAPTCASAA